MATAVQPSTTTLEANPRTKLAIASVVGAAFVIAGVCAAAYALPEAWSRVVAPVLAPLGPFANVALRLVAQVAAAIAIIWLGLRFAGSQPPKGMRGGIFLTISAVITIFFVTRAVGLNLEGSPVGLPITLVVLGGLLFGTFRMLTSAKGQGWMHGIEEQGLLSTFNYKKTQGIRARRYTLLGFLIIGWTGVYSMYANETAGVGDWTLKIPFTTTSITPLVDRQFAIPMLFAAATFWLAWRAVNMPTFADFLIATEAEMNKVSWPTRKGLFQDTIVVLVTTVLLTAFLLAIDLFWGWLLSTSWIGVLPGKDSIKTQQIDPIQGKKAAW